MPRRREVPKRKILPDPKFRDKNVAKFNELREEFQAVVGKLKKRVARS